MLEPVGTHHDAISSYCSYSYSSSSYHLLLLLLKVVVVVLVLLLIVIIIIGIFGRLVCLAPRTQNDLCSNGGKKEVLGGSLLTGYFTDFHK